MRQIPRQLKFIVRRLSHAPVLGLLIRTMSCLAWGLLLEAQKSKEGSSMSSESFEPWALPVLSAWPKVLQIVHGGIPTPEVVEIFPTNTCNFHCPHCRFKNHHGDATAFADYQMLQRLLSDLAANGIRNIELSGGGEPLVHPKAIEFFDRLIDEKFRVGLITNGYPFVDNVQLQDRALECCTWIRFSVDAFTDDTYRRVHGGKRLSYGALRRSISVMRKRVSGVPRIGVKMLISKLNAKDVSLAVSESLEIGADYLQLKFLGSPSALVLPAIEVENITAQVQDQLAPLPENTLSVDFLPPYRGAPKQDKCLMTFLHPVVDWDGEMYICAFFEHRKQSHSLGNIRDGGFFAVWGSPSHRATFNAVDSQGCVPNCPMSRYNPLVNFVVAEDYRRGFI